MSDNYINSNGVSRLWRNILQKLNSYVTKNGDGATGTWGINISGNAKTATKATQDGAGNVIVNTYATKNEVKQSDWNQTDETAMDFIKNKPDVATKDYVDAPKSQFTLVDQVTGENYIVCMKEGNLVTYKAE